MRTKRSTATTIAPTAAQGRRHRARSGSTSPAYFLGRSEAVWTSALSRLR